MIRSCCVVSEANGNILITPMKINDPFLSLAMDVRQGIGKVWCVTLAPSYIRGCGTKKGFFIGKEKWRESVK